MEKYTNERNISIWRTGHEIADTVANALEEGLYGNESLAELSIGYGILRGNAERIRACEANEIPWFNIDRGYFKPNHYDGFYRVSLQGTQQTIGLSNVRPDYKRLEQLGIEFPKPHYINHKAHTLIVPPTGYVAEFFGVAGDWIDCQLLWYCGSTGKNRIRQKGCLRPIDDDLTNCLRVVTFNSSIGWEALRRGIPVYSDPNHSIVGAYQKLVDKPLHLDFKARKALFGIMAGLQLTLDEIRHGYICPLIEKLMCLSDGTAEKLSPATSQPTPLQDVLQFQQSSDF